MEASCSTAQDTKGIDKIEDVPDPGTTHSTPIEKKPLTLLRNRINCCCSIVASHEQIHKAGPTRRLQRSEMMQRSVSMPETEGLPPSPKRKQVKKKKAEEVPAGIQLQPLKGTKEAEGISPKWLSSPAEKRPGPRGELEEVAPPANIIENVHQHIQCLFRICCKCCTCCKVFFFI